MNSVALVSFPLLLLIFSTASEGARPGDNVFSVTANCSANSQPCGPAPSCCAPGLICNFNRGIPTCVDVSQQTIEGFDHLPCADPYLFSCDDALGIPGFCCPIGTSCFTVGNDNIIHCINAVGTTAPAIPSATTGLVPSATPISSNNPAIIYSPSDAWNVSNSLSNCTTSSSLHVTDIINATISFNYTGPSIMVRTVSSSSTGVFAVFVDGVNTTGLIDTFSGPGDLSLPVCYPVQFPPFITTPPGYENRTNHNITLIYTGPSELAPEGTNISIVQFDSFAIPDLESVLVPTSNQGSMKLQNLNVYLLLVLLTWSLFVLV